VRTILLAIAEYQRQIIKARTRAAIRRMQSEGRRMCAIHLLPFEQMPDPADNSRMVENPDEQKVIQRILELKQTGISLRAIARQLNDEGYMPRMVRRKWKGENVYVKGKLRHYF